MTEIHTCPSCGEKKFNHFLTCLDHSISKQKFDLEQCPNCGLVITNPRPSSEDLDRYYLSEDYTSHTSRAKNIVDKLYILARTFTLRWKNSLVSRHTTLSPNKTILDYGCGTGQFINYLHKLGWKVEGVEPSAVARQNAPESIKTSIAVSLEDINSQKKYTAITLWHVLEHVHNLDVTLQSLRSRLENDGTLFIAVPNYMSWDAKKYQAYWAGYDVPRHLWHFSKKNMELLLAKNDLRLTRILPMRLDAIYVSILSEKYLSHGKLNAAGIIKGFATGITSNLKARNTNAYSSLIYIVKK